MPYERRRSTAKIAPEKLHAHYFDDTLNREVFHKVADKCYWPATKLILELVEGLKSQEKPFRVAYGLSGTLLDQIERYSPELLDVFKRLADSGMVESARRLKTSRDRKSTRLNSSHQIISYAVFCLKKKTKSNPNMR